MQKSDYATAARARKAESIALRLRLRGLSVSDAARLDDEERRSVERDAAVRKASDETWRLAIAMHAGSASTTCPTCGHGDPDGVPGPPRPFGHDGPCSQ